MSDWKKLSDNVDCQQDWSPRNTGEDRTLEVFADTCEWYSGLGNHLDVAIAKIDGYTYVLVDWEEEESVEDTEKAIAFRIKN